MIDAFPFLCLLHMALPAVNEPRKYWYWTWAVLPAFLLDLWLAHTTWPLAAGFPRKNEWTISSTLERLVDEEDNLDHVLWIALSHKINRVAGYGHIRNAGKWKTTAFTQI